MVGVHVDVIQLDYCRLGKVARRVASAVAADQCRRISKKCVGTLLVTAVTGDKVLQVDRLNEKLRLQVEELRSHD